MQIPLHKNNDPTHIRIQPKKQDTIQKKTNDPNKKPFQKSLEPPKNNPFLQALMPPQQNVDRPKQVISTPDTSIQQAEDQLQDKSTDTAFHTYKKHDPADKKLIIFINGFWGLPTLACCGGAKDYWGKDGWWAQAVQDQVGDWNDWYFDGSSGGSAALAWQFYERLLPGHPRISTSLSHAVRYQAGYEMGKTQAADIIASLERDNHGNIIESVKFVTNSMGLAYERGFSQALHDYVADFNAKVRARGFDPTLEGEIIGFETEFVLDVAGFQASSVGKDPNTPNNYFMRSQYDPVAGYESAAVTDALEIGIDMNTGKPLNDHLYGWQAADLILPDGSLCKGCGFTYKERHHASNFGNKSIQTIPYIGLKNGSQNMNNNQGQNKTPDFEEHKP